MKLIVVTIRDSDDWNTHIELYNYAKDKYYPYKVLNKNKFKVYGDTYYKDSTFYIKNDLYIPLLKSETKSLTSHIVLEKKKDYHSYEIKNNAKYKKESIFTKIKKWFND